MPNKLIGSFFILMFILIMAGCQAQETSTTDMERAFPVHIAVAQTGLLKESQLFTGEIVASKELNISPKVSGTVQAVYVKKGQRVEADQVLAALEQTDFENNIKQAKVSLQTAQVNVENAKLNYRKGVEQAELNLKNSEIAFEEVQVSLSNAMTTHQTAETNYQRVLTLYEHGAMAKQELEQAENTLKQAVAGLQQNELSLKKAQAAIQAAEKAMANAKRTESIKVAEASVAQAKLSIELAERQKEQTVITAPMSGEITKTTIELGELASSQTVLFTLVQTEPLLVKASVTEEMLVNLEVNKELSIFVKSIQAEVKGKVTFISSVKDPQTKVYPIEIELFSSTPKVKPGMLAEIAISLHKNDIESVLVPSSALILANQEYNVFVVNGDRAERKLVEVGEENEHFVQIKKGLTKGEKVIVKGHLTLEDGSLIQIAEVNKHEAN